MIQKPNIIARRARRAAGFTLLEAALTTMIVGVGLVATLQLLASGTSANIDGAQTTTGLNLAKGVREMTLNMTFDAVRALDGKTYTPPVDSRGEPINSLSQWTQTVDVQSVDPDQFTTEIVDPSPDAVRVTVTLSQNGENVCSIKWYRFRPLP